MRKLNWLQVAAVAIVTTAATAQTVAAQDKRLPVAPSSFGAHCVALTFDDGPDVVLTPKLLDILKAENVTATFYVVGQRVAKWPEVVRRASQEGHEIGNHSWSHPVLTQLSTEQVVQEIAKTDQAIKDAIGSSPATIRPPYGSHSARVDRAVSPRPMIMWDTDTLDWLYRNPDRVTRVADGTPGGTVVLMHDIHATTIRAVPGLIRGLKERGFRFVTVSQLLRGACGAFGGFASGGASGEGSAGSYY